MNLVGVESGFVVWGADHAPYGPVELPTLVNWVKDERVKADTWVYDEKTQSWQLASQVPELRMFFQPKAASAPTLFPPTPSALSVSAEIKLGALRRVKILANLDDQQLQRFAQFMEVERVPQWTVIVRQGDFGDTMYLILEGELRVRMMVDGKETILAALGPGEFFGDIFLFDHGPRSADVVANHDSVLLKVSTVAFHKLAKEAPDLATPFLLAISKTLTARIRADNKRYRDSIHFARAAGP